MVEATTHYDDPEVLIRVSENLGEAMVGIDINTLEEGQLLQTRGW
jgi:pyridoxal 5'-phosphate synthase pdxS subunit